MTQLKEQTPADARPNLLRTVFLFKRTSAGNAEVELFQYDSAFSSDFSRVILPEK